MDDDTRGADAPTVLSGASGGRAAAPDEPTIGLWRGRGGNIGRGADCARRLERGADRHRRVLCRWATLRAMIAWAPAFGFAAAMNWSDVTFTGGAYRVRVASLLALAAAFFVVFVVGSIVAAVRPTAGLQDRFAGTLLVPR